MRRNVEDGRPRTSIRGMNMVATCLLREGIHPKVGTGYPDELGQVPEGSGQVMTT